MSVCVCVCVCRLETKQLLVDFHSPRNHAIAVLVERFEGSAGCAVELILGDIFIIICVKSPNNTYLSLS